MKSLKIYLGDLTYDTITLSTETFPLNIGFIASYCIKKFGAAVDITLFKYIDKLERAINESPPDILGMSNYSWCKNVSLEMFKIIRNKNPNALTVMGGPNFPLDLSSQKKFMNQHSEIDVYVPIDGETGFSNIIECVLEVDSVENIRNKVMEKPIEGCISRRLDKDLQYSNPGIRIKELDEIPSPYQNGLLDEFFDDRLSPILQTNRGCPFSCTFCVDGSSAVNKVNSFSLQRVFGDIKYVCEHVSKNIHTLFMSDLNFGMFTRDIEICKAISAAQKKHNYPHQIACNTGKNRKENIIKAIEQLDGALNLFMSVQSLDEEVLSNIRRSNISVDNMMDLAPAIKKAGLRTTSEIIVGLPGETYDSHVETIHNLIRSKIDVIQPYSCMLLDGSELATPEERKKWNLKTKFRIMPHDFVILDNGKKVAEVEEIVISSDSLSFDEYIELRLLSFIITTTTKIKAFDHIIKFMREIGEDPFQLYYNMLKQEEKAPKKIQDIFNNFRDATKKELWNSPDEIHEYIQNDVEYQKLLDGKLGSNLLQHFYAIVTVEIISEWKEYIIKILNNILRMTGRFDEYMQKQFYDIANYCSGLCHNIVGKDRFVTNPEFEFHHNMIRWINDQNNSELRSFKESYPIKMTFRFSEEQFKILEDELLLHPNTLIGKGQALKRIPPDMLCRQPKNVN